MRRCMPVPKGIVMDRASFTPGMAFTATVCPMERPGPKLVYVTPSGAQACISARTTESDPGSQPALIMLTASAPLASASRRERSPGI